MKNAILLLSLFFLLSACAEVRFIPQPQMGAAVDLNSLAVSQQQDSMTVSVRVGDARVRPTPGEKNYCSFWIEVSNQRNLLLSLSYADFTLRDAAGHQFPAQAPDQLVALLTAETPYLVPYPYVGYYYLGDAERARAADQFRSEASYATSRRPEYIKIDALPEGDVLPRSKVAGMIYFPADLRPMGSFEVIYQAAAPLAPQPLPLRFRFSVEKN